jgi:hypothetical protein
VRKVSKKLDPLFKGDFYRFQSGVLPALAMNLTPAAVAVGGLIGFVGIIVPHTVRLIVGGSYRSVLPLSVLFGAAFLIVVDILARTLVAPGEIPIGVITAFVGAPFFIVVLRPRGPVTATLEWARSWADPERKLRTWRGTFWFFVPALIVTIIGTFVVPLLSR